MINLKIWSGQKSPRTFAQGCTTSYTQRHEVYVRSHVRCGTLTDDGLTHGSQVFSLNDIIDYHAHCKTKVVKCESVPYMNSELHKALYKRNMARNKFRKYGKMYWEENRTHRNTVVSLRKKSIATYFSKNCSKHDKSFCSTVSPFISDKKIMTDSKIILQEGDEIIVDNLKVVNVFNDYFCDVALNIRFDDSITSLCDAIA